MNQFNGISAESVNDPSKQLEICHYLEILKKDNNGWKKSIESILTQSSGSYEEQFLLLQVVEDYLQKRYHNGHEEDQRKMKEFFLNYIKIYQNNNTDVPAYLINKFAQVLSLAFSADFPERWSSFFQDLFFSQDLSNTKAALFYLKVLHAIDSEVVDRDIQRSKNECDRNIKIKDAMREICVPQIAQSWPTIMTTIEDDNVQCLVLEAIGSYVDWIDVELVANDTVMGLVIDRLSKSATSEAATNAVCGLLQKGMPVDKKATLTLTLMNVFKSNGLLTITDSTDEDNVTRVGSLVNNLGLVLLQVHQKLCESSVREDQQGSCVNEMADLAVPALSVLSNEDPSISELTVDFIHSYIVFLLKFYPDKTDFIEKVIRICLARYVFNDEMNVDGDGEEETEYQEYRKELRSLLNPIGVKRPEVIVAAIEPWAVEVTSQGSMVPVKKIEALLHLVFHLHEIIPSNILQTPKEGISERACRLPIALLKDVNLDGRSSTVHVTYFELACRYERLLSVQQNMGVIPQIAGAFLDQRGIAIPVVNLRTRIVYLFCRFVKAHKAVLSSLVSEVITRLAPLLAVSPQADTGQLLSPDDQAYVFEASANLIAFGDLSPDLKSQYFGELASTLAGKFETAAVELNAARLRNADEETINSILTFMSNVIIYCCKMSKAFNNVQSMKACNCVEIYLKLLKLFVDNLSAESTILLESTRQFAHRLVVSMEEEILPYMGMLFEKLASLSTDLDSMQHLLIFCNQAVTKYKKDIMSCGVDIGNVLLIAARVSLQEQENMTAPKDDSQRELQYVQRAFLQLLYSVIVKDCLEQLNNQPGLIDQLLEAASRLALSTDQTSQKVALSCLAKASQVIPAWSVKTLRVALEVPSLAHISPADAGSTIVVHEVCATLSTLLNADPNGFSQAIRELLPNGFSEQLLNILFNLKGKNLDKEVMNLYATIRNR